MCRAAQEIAWFLEAALGVTSKTQWYQSGDEVAASGRSLALHFETQVAHPQSPFW